ncbi:hypothetical protein C8F04DRAFT_486623 [Mycena alexandri]|uniref:Haemolytic enterotoxin (HBL) n=1 Tax=Mycena alexandri TaxID=1745969 RepID=A0AAD6WLN1_9AGAR|nr:hypothetical protein C8F04DRAFT_486623 [Mycena alexandri]
MSVAVATPGQVSDLFANPDALHAAFNQKLQQDPTGVTKSLSDYLQDDDTRQHMVQEAQDGLQAIHDIQLAFERVYGLLAQVDAQNFKGPDGNVIQKLAPTWRGYSDTFTQSLTQTETLATKGKAAVDTFVKNIIPILQNTSMSVTDKATRLTFFTNNIDQNDQNVKAIDALLLIYDQLGKDVAAFKASFETKMQQVGQKLDLDIARAKEDIEGIKTKLAEHQEAAKKLGISAGISAGIGAGLLATGFLAPLAYACFGASLVLGIKAIDEWFNEVQKIKGELADRENDLAGLESQRTAYQKLVPACASASQDMSLISGKLQILTQVFKLVKSDIVDASTHLNTASQADNADVTQVRNDELELAAASYSMLAVILETFATGWSTQVKAPSS